MIVRTATRAILASSSGVTLMHESLVADLSILGVYFSESNDLMEAELADQEIVLEKLRHIQDPPKSHRDKRTLDNAYPADEEVQRVEERGRPKIGDPTIPDIGRNSKPLLETSTRTNTNVVMRAGLYSEQSCPNIEQVDENSIDAIADKFISDVSLGVERSHVGIIGEIGHSLPIADVETKVPRDAVNASAATGTLLSIHPGIMDSDMSKLIKIVALESINFQRIMFDHIFEGVLDT